MVNIVRSEMFHTLVHTQRYYPNEGQQTWKRQRKLKKLMHRKLLAIVKLE